MSRKRHTHSGSKGLERVCFFIFPVAEGVIFVRFEGHIKEEINNYYKNKVTSRKLSVNRVALRVSGRNLRQKIAIFLIKLYLPSCTMK